MTPAVKKKVKKKSENSGEVFKKSEAKAVKEMLEILEKTYPDARVALKHENPLQLLVATILSAQCTDERVNMVTPRLFARYPDAQSYAEADLEELKEIIHSTGFYNNKAKNIKAMAGKVVTNFGGRVPDNMEDMLNLPGVARKTANVVLGSAFGKSEGIVVDTHVLRLSFRLGLSDNRKNAEITERNLLKIIPKDKWIWFAHALITHGRRVCKAKKPDCKNCVLSKLCPSAFADVK